MGIGDEIMAAGQARELHEKTGLAVLICGRDGRGRWHEAWAGLPYILREPKGQYVRLVNAPGVRPYIEGKFPAKWRWRKFGPPRGELVLSEEEKKFARMRVPMAPAVLIEPNVKAIGHDNKAWPWQRWVDLVGELTKTTGGGLPLIQCGAPDTRRLPGTLFIETPTWRLGAAVLAECAAFVGTEGGMMHVAAALRRPAVILWSEFIAPEITGYPQLRNVRRATKTCGMRIRCDGCKKSMEAITVAEVARNLMEILA